MLLQFGEFYINEDYIESIQLADKDDGLHGRHEWLIVMHKQDDFKFICTAEEMSKIVKGEKNVRTKGITSI